MGGLHGHDSPGAGTGAEADADAGLARIDNAPGRSAIAYRIGDFASFRADLLRRAAGRRELDAWAFRERGDPGFALLEMWASIADVLTFYQERAANEAYVRTAVQRDSLARLAAMLGYRPRPGSAAAARLAFQIEKGKSASLPPRLKVQGGPPGAKPLTFETVEAVAADARLNRVRVLPRPVATDPFRKGSTGTLLQRGAAAPPPNGAIALVGPALLERKTVVAAPERHGRPALAWAPEVQSAALDPFGAVVVPVQRSFRAFGWNAGASYVEAVEDKTAPGQVSWKARQVDDHALALDGGNTLPLEAKVDDLKPGSRVVLETTRAGAAGPRTRVATIAAVTSGHSRFAGVDAAVTHATLGFAVASPPRVVRDGVGRLRALAVADDGAAWEAGQVRPSSHWGSWQSLGGRLADLWAAPLATRPPGRLLVVGRSPGGQLWQAREEAPGRWSRWSRLDGLDAAVADAGLLAERDGRLRLLAVGADGVVRQAMQAKPDGPWGAWTPLGGALASVSAVREADGRLAAFGLGLDGAVWHAAERVAGGPWTPWSSLGHQATLVRGAVNQDGRLEAFARGRDGALWHAWQTSVGGPWSAWRSRGGHFGDFAVAANLDGRLEVVTGGAGSRLAHAWQVAPNGSWSEGWPQLAPTADRVALAANADGRLEAFGRAPDGALVHAWQLAPNGAWSGEGRLGFPMWAVHDRRRLVVHEVTGPPLPLWPFDHPDQVAGAQVFADLAELDRLDAGRTVLVEDGDGAPHAATVTAAAPADLDGDGADDHLAVALSPALPRPFATASAHLLGNVALATHGETVADEVLGSGDAAVPFQAFGLADAPLTFLAKPGGAGGRAAALEVRVDGVLWTEVPDLLGAGPVDRVYCVEPDATGAPVVRFGDGVRGARLPTGRNNVVATYRKGLGAQGNLARGALARPLDRPPGLRGVAQPGQAAGGEDPEAAQAIRENAPNSVRTFGRIVSLRDFEDAARAFPGIAKAKASWRWEAGSPLLLLTVAGVGGTVVEGPLLEGLVRDLDARRDPYRHLAVRPHRPRPIQVEAAVAVEPAHLASAVLPAVRRALAERFSFERQALGAPVHLSDVQAAIQAVPGVAAVDVDRFGFRLDLAGDGALRFLRARRARFLGRQQPDPVQPRLAVLPDEVALLADPAADAIVKEAGPA